MIPPTNALAAVNGADILPTAASTHDSMLVDQAQPTRLDPTHSDARHPLCGHARAEPLHPLAGTWELARAEIARPDGTVVVDPNYGPKATGLLIIDQSGRYSLQVFRPDRPKFASGDKARGTPEEYMSALLGLSTHTGFISVDAANQSLIFHIAQAAFPNWEHTDQTRAYLLVGEELSYRVPPRPTGTSAISVWRRVTG